MSAVLQPSPDAPADPPQVTPNQPGEGIWHAAFRKLSADRAAMIAAGFFGVIVLLCVLAPLYADLIAHTDPFHSNINGEMTLNGETVAVIASSTEGLGLGQTPIGPTWHGSYLLGADDQGRDVAARMLYGGRASLLVSFGATALCLLVGAALGIVAGFFGGLVDSITSRVLEILWAFPVYLLAISLSIVTISQGLTIGPVTIDSSSLILPTLIIGIIYIPYIARPVRGQVLALKRTDFVLASIGLGVPTGRILLRDIFPNVAPTLIVMVPLMVALNMLTESALSFLSIGVQAPNASWGTIIQDGQGLLYTRPMVAIAPGIAIVITVLALNVLGDGMRDALDPRSKVRIGAAST
jgi:peptide/nickel transport system permease protein